jgi:hypothetical protein
MLTKKSVDVYGGLLEEEFTTNGSFLYVIEGSCSANGVVYCAGTGTELNELTVLKPLDCAYIMVFELPPEL